MTVAATHGEVLAAPALPGVQPSREVPRVLARQTPNDFYRQGAAQRRHGKRVTLREMVQTARQAAHAAAEDTLIELEVVAPPARAGRYLGADALEELSVDFHVNELRLTVRGTADPEEARTAELPAEVVEKTRMMPAVHLERFARGTRVNLKRERRVADPTGETRRAVREAPLGTYAWRAKRRRSHPVPDHPAFRVDVTEVTESNGITRTEVEMECLAPAEVTDEAVIAAMRAAGLSG